MQDTFFDDVYSVTNLITFRVASYLEQLLWNSHMNVSIKGKFWLSPLHTGPITE
jgi:hypothetical protein